MDIIHIHHNNDGKDDSNPTTLSSILIGVMESTHVYPKYWYLRAVVEYQIWGIGFGYPVMILPSF